MKSEIQTLILNGPFKKSTEITIVVSRNISLSKLVSTTMHHVVPDGVRSPCQGDLAADCRVLHIVIVTNRYISDPIAGNGH